MDANRFDQFIRSFSTIGTRRGLVRLLGILPLVCALALPTVAQVSSAKGKGRRGKPRGRNENGNGSQDRDRDPRKKKNRGQAGAENHKHEGRRRKHRNKRNRHHNHKDKDKHKPKDKKKPCTPQSPAETCAGRCGSVQNNCQQAVDCGSCDCEPPCPVCQVCNAETVTCEPDAAQVGESCGDGLVCQTDGACACEGSSCGGCRRCEAGQCIPDDSIVCEPSDQCHEAGECDPETGQCTNPRKADDTPCERDDPCTINTACQQGECVGTPKDCSAEDDVCNRGVCDPGTGQCRKEPRANGTACNADNDRCTDGDSCQSGVCTPGAGVDCSTEDDQCNVGVCNPEDGQCRQEPRQDGTACDAGGDGCTEGDACRAGTCEPGAPRVCPVCKACSDGDCRNVDSDTRCQTVCCGGVCCEAGDQCDGNQCPVVCLGLREGCDPNDNQCCDASCEPNRPNCGDAGNRCCHGTGETCADGCECCGESSCEGNACCHLTRGSCQSAADCCQNFLNQQDCVAGRCCALPEQPCEGPDDCCDGLCDPEDSVCTNCLSLQTPCEDGSQCCQRGEVTLCTWSCDFNVANCCHPPGGTCASDCDCCEGVACSNGRCCAAEYAICESNDECCSGFECRAGIFGDTKRCRIAICREPGEDCDAVGCCQDGVTACANGTCCRPLGSPCEQVPDVDSPCCDGVFQDCAGVNQTCCLTDFSRVPVPPGIVGPPCTANDECCSNFCHTPTGNCCRTAAQPCSTVGELGFGFDCCPWQGLTCGESGSCVPCGNVGETCFSDPERGDSTCCLGLDCQNGHCVQDQCGGILAPCQNDNVCCPGHACTLDSLTCNRVCAVGGEVCGAPTDLPCCGGLTCTEQQTQPFFVCR